MAFNSSRSSSTSVTNVQETNTLDSYNTNQALTTQTKTGLSLLGSIDQGFGASIDSLGIESGDDSINFGKVQDGLAFQNNAGSSLQNIGSGKVDRNNFIQGDSNIQDSIYIDKSNSGNTAGRDLTASKTLPQSQSKIPLIIFGVAALIVGAFFFLRKG